MSGALPKLNATPTHELTIPSSGQKVSYRPYLVKEEKILLLAFESQDEKQAMQAMVDTIINYHITKLSFSLVFTIVFDKCLKRWIL